MADGDPTVRVTELLASVSLATDLATGQPLGHGLSTSHLAVAIARELGYDPERVRSIQQAALLRFLGCTSDAHESARMVGDDEQRFFSAMAPVVMGRPTEALGAVFRVVGAGEPLPRRTRLLAVALTDPPGRSLKRPLRGGSDAGPAPGPRRRRGGRPGPCL